MLKTTIRLLALLLLLCPAVAGAYNSTYYTTESVLATGRWVKISVSETGIHQLSYERIKAMGFDNPSKVVVYGYGGSSLTSNAFSNHTPDDLKPTASLHTADGRLLFYGEADLSLTANSLTSLDVRRNLYDTKGYYFITDSPSGHSAEAPTAVETKYEPLTHHLSVAYVENDIQNPANGGSYFHDKPFAAGEERDYHFDIVDFETSNKLADFKCGQIAYEFAALWTKATSLDPIYPSSFSVSDITNNNAPLQTQETKFFIGGTGSAKLTAVDYSGCHTIKFRVKPSLTPNYAALDKAFIIYPRKNSLSDQNPEIVMNLPYTGSYDAVSIATVSDAVKVWDITDATDIASCYTITDTTNSTVIAGIPVVRRFSTSPRRLIAFDTKAAYPEASFAEEIVNQNLHGMTAPEMVIITTDYLRPAAERLADIHRNHDGMDVKVVTQKAIFNEFSSGSRAAMAYRRFLKMLYDREPETLKHVLFYGHGSLDNRREQPREELLCYETEDVNQSRDRTKNYTSDRYFTMLESNFNEDKIYAGKMSINAGRIDVVSETEADNINAKIERFLNRRQSPAVYNSILAICDDGDDQGHFFDAEDHIKMLGCNPNMSFTRVYNVVYPWINRVAEAGRKAIKTALKSGHGMFLYSGHCTHSALTGERLYDVNLISQTSYEDYPFAMLATCETFGFDRNSQLLAPAMLNESRGGAIGIIGSSRSVYMEYNRTIAQAICEAYAKANSHTTIGDILRIAHNSCIGKIEVDRAINSMCYNLCGDPSLKIGAPDYQVFVESLDRYNLPSQYKDTLDVNALTPFIIEGHISDGQSVISDFNGEMLIRVFDTPIKTQTNDKSSTANIHHPVTLDQDVIAETVLKVTNGRFKTEMTLPLPRDGEGVNRLTFNAVSDANNTSASGALKNIKISDDATADFTDTDAPQITQFYIDSPTFADGGIIGSSASAYATISLPSSGLNVSTAIGAAPTLLIDNATSCNDYTITINSDATASIVAQLGNLIDGRHTLSLTVRSNCGVSTTETIGFIVSDNSVSSSLELDNSLVRESLEITLNHQFNSIPNTRIIIEDASGKTVYSVTDCQMPFVWNLKDNSGKDVADGRYFVYVLAHDDLNYSATAKNEFVVIRK